MVGEREVAALPVTDGVEPERDALTEIEPPHLRRAARRVAAEWLASTPSPERYAEVVAHLAALARAAATDETESPASLPAAAAAVRRRLVGPFRTELVRAWREADTPPDPAAMLRALTALDDLHHALDPAWESYFAQRVTAPAGLELMVEVAHDLRSPLTSILFLAETLRRGQSGEVNELQTRQLGLIYSAALGMVSIASDLIELAHGGDRLVDPLPAPFSVAQLLESVCDIVRPLAEEKKLALRVLPPEGDCRVGYEAALSRVLLNLTTNALKYAEDGFIELVARPKGPTCVEFSLRDTGKGLSHEVRMTLYEPFRRTGTSDDRFGFSGSGLGLSICRRLVQAMGSELHYETAPDWGTRFFFDLELPLAGL